MNTVLIFAVCLAVAFAEYKSYNGYTEYNVYITEEQQSGLIHYFLEESSGIIPVSMDIITGQKIIQKIVVSPQAKFLAKRIFDSNHIVYNVSVEDLGRLFAEEEIRQKLTLKLDDPHFNLNRYYRYEQIENYLLWLADSYSDIVSLETIATTYEKRNITMLKIGKADRNKPIFFIEGGIHAREWISPAQVLYIIKQLVENEDNRPLIENVNWYIVPLVNPDGTDRFPGAVCCGVDLNRNFNFQWMKTGASSNECSADYAGTKPSSELETIGLQNTIMKYSNNIKLYLSFHSHGQYILYPWSHTSAKPDNVDELDALATEVAKSIATLRKTKYTVGTANELLYSLSGSSFDWAKNNGVPLSYSIELPDGGNTGFDPPISDVPEIVQDTWNGVLKYYSYIDSNCIQKYYQ